jgi:type I restriction enzyme S subunit
VTDLPPGWKWARLDDLAEPVRGALTDGPFGSNLKTEHYTESGPRVLRLQNVGDGVFHDAFAHISQERYDNLTKHHARAGDVLIAALGEELPRACLLPEGIGSALVKADVFRLRTRPDVNARFVVAMLNSPQVRAVAASQISGVGRPRLNLAKTRLLRVPLPPRDEQDRIVAAIEARESQLSNGVDLLMRARARIRTLRASMLHSRFCADDFSWPVKAIGEFAIVGSGATPKRTNPKYFDGGTVPWVTSGQLSDDQVTSPAAYITPLAVKETSVRLWPKHTLLVAMYGEGKTRGQCSELMFESTTNQACAAIVVDEAGPVTRGYLKWVLRANYEKNRRLAAGGVQPNLSLGLIKAMDVAVPPVDVQELAVDLTERDWSMLGAMDHAVTRSLDRASGLRQGLRASAFRGELGRDHGRGRQD